MADSLSLATIDQRMMESQGDYLEFTVTTAIAASLVIVSTTLKSFDHASDDYFNNWWVYITDKTTTDNTYVERRVSDYATATGTLTVYGANLTVETPDTQLATCQLSCYRRTDRVKAINDTLREQFPSLHKRIDSQILITNNFLPNAHFEDWALTTVPDKYALSSANISSLEETTIIRGGVKSMKATTAAGGAGAYVKLTKANYPRLLDLSGQQVTISVWAYCTLANDAFIQIYTKDTAGTTQTLTSTTTAVITTWTLITLADQVLNDDLVDCEIRFGITTLSQSVYFDDARLIATQVKEYLLPTVLDDSKIQQVKIQAGGYYESSNSYMVLSDSIAPQGWNDYEGEWSIINDGTNKWLRLEDGEVSGKRIRLIGVAPFTALSASTDAIIIDQEKVPLLVAYAKYNFYNRLSGTVSSEDKTRYEREAMKSLGEYQRLAHLKMAMPTRMMSLPSW